MEISVKGLWMGASVVITAVLITLGLMQLGNARQLSRAAAESVSRTTRELIYSDIWQYDNAEVRGSDVRSFARRSLKNGTSDRVPITVQNKENTRSYTEYEETEAMYEQDGVYYVTPADMYIGKVVINGNDVITEIQFIKQ